MEAVATLDTLVSHWMAKNQEKTKQDIPSTCTDLQCDVKIRAQAENGEK